MMKLLIIGQHTLPIPKQMFGYNIVSIPYVLKPAKLFKSILRAIFMRTKSRFRLYFYDIETILTKCNNCDIIILHDCMPVDVLNIMMNQIENSVNADVRLILYFWNKIKGYEKLIVVNRWEYLTFDYIDSMKYGFRYVGGFYNPVEVKIERKTDEVFFVGKDGGRYKDLYHVEKYLKERGLKPRFVYVSPFKSLFSKKYSHYIPYNDVLKMTIESDAVLEWVKYGQSGLTLRTYEAIFYNKKLITNNKDIKSYYFYDESNILLFYPHISIEEIKRFLSRPMNLSIYEKYKNYYAYENWLNRVLLNCNEKDRI